jgi:minichromosome maintenance protein 10
MSRAQPAPSDDEEEEDEETLQLKLQAIEARLRLKKLQKAKRAADDGETNSADVFTRPGTAASTRRTDLPRPRSEVQVPVSPVRNRREPEEQKSPARVLLGIDKGLRAQDVSLKRASSLSTRTAAGAHLRTRSATVVESPRIKSFSERIADSRIKEKEREEKQARIDKSRSGGFGLHNIEGVKDRPASRAAFALSSRPRNSDDPEAAGKGLAQSRHISNLRDTATPRPGSTLSGRLERTPSTASRQPSNGFGSTATAAKYAEISQRDDSTDSPSFESFSGMHLKSREMQHNVVTRTLDGKTVVTIPQLLKTVKAPEYDPPDMENDYVIMGVIAAKSSPMATKNSVKQRTAGYQEEDAHATNKFMVITLTDLKWELQLFLFDTGFSKFWKLTPGTLIAILNPEILPPRDRGSTKFSLKLTSSDDTVLEIGSARDLDFCHAMKKDGKECAQWIDGRKTEFCDFHLELQVEKSKRGRMEVNTMTGFGKGPGAGRGSTFGSAGRGRGKGDQLKREGKYHDAFLHETMYITPGAGSAPRLMDRDEQPYSVTERAEKHRKQLAEKEKERELARRLGELGNGAGGDYMRRAALTSAPAMQSESSRSASALDDPFITKPSGPGDVLGLLNKRAEDVSLGRDPSAAAKRKRAISGKSIASNEPAGWAGAGKRGLLSPSRGLERASSMRRTREPSPAKKKARLFLPEKGIREPGRDSLGTMDVGLLAAMDDDDDLEVV